MCQKHTLGFYNFRILTWNYDNGIINPTQRGVDMNKDHHKILGIKKNASIEEIKKAYKARVKEFHPDVNNNPDSVDMFIKIKTAYEELIKSKTNNSIFSDYKIAGNNFDINFIDPDCIFVGDIYVVKYKLRYDFFASFEEQTYKQLVEKNAVLLRVGFCEYINLSKIKNDFDLEQIQTKLNDKSKRSKVVILGDFFKPYADQYIAVNVIPYSIFDENEKINHSSLIKKMVINR